MNRQLSTAAILCAICVLVTACAGCKSSPISHAARGLSPGEIIDGLHAAHPDGVSPEIAQRRMEECGFECSHILDGTWVHKVRQDDHVTIENVSIDNIDFIHCKRQIQTGLVTSYDDVALIIENNIVANMLANWDAVGP